MNKENRFSVHNVNLPFGYVPNPRGHVSFEGRDKFHYDWARTNIEAYSSVLDIGVWDGWLDMLLIEDGFKVNGTELIPALGEAALRYAQSKGYDYKMFTGFFTELTFAEKSYDTIIAFEVLEHIEFPEALQAIDMMDKIARKSVLISLPDQKFEENPQHLWTPTLDLIQETFKGKKDLSVIKHDYPGTNVPSNFMIKYFV